MRVQELCDLLTSARASIVLLTTEKNAERSTMQAQAKAIGASELTVPATIMVVDKVPLLGSGKTDYVTATTMAREQATASEREVAQRPTDRRRTGGYAVRRTVRSGHLSRR